MKTVFVKTVSPVVATELANHIEDAAKTAASIGTMQPLLFGYHQYDAAGNIVPITGYQCSPTQDEYVETVRIGNNTSIHYISSDARIGLQIDCRTGKMVISQECETPTRAQYVLDNLLPQYEWNLLSHVKDWALETYRTDNLMESARSGLLRGSVGMEYFTTK